MVVGLVEAVGDEFDKRTRMVTAKMKVMEGNPDCHALS